MEIPPWLFNAISIAIAAITGYGSAKFARGKDAQRLETLEKLSDTRDEVLHNRINKMQQETSQVLEKLDSRSIQMIEKMGELKGMIAMTNHGKEKT